MNGSITTTSKFIRSSIFCTDHIAIYPKAPITIILDGRETRCNFCLTKEAKLFAVGKDSTVGIFFPNFFIAYSRTAETSQVNVTAFQDYQI